MKILVLADEADPRLWEHFDKRRLEGIDLIISCGDLPASYLSFLTCFTHAPILYVHGNHDVNYAQKPPEGCICIEDKLYVHNGVRIVGLGGCMRYRRNQPHQYTEYEMACRACRLIVPILLHGGFDILVAHAPAYGIGDGQDIAHHGFKTFIRMMDHHHPRYFLHGHVHQSYVHDFRAERVYRDTIVVNACGSHIIEIPDRPHKRLLLRKKG